MVPSALDSVPDSVRQLSLWLVDSVCGTVVAEADEGAGREGESLRSHTTSVAQVSGGCVPWLPRLSLNPERTSSRIVLSWVTFHRTPNQPAENGALFWAAAARRTGVGTTQRYLSSQVLQISLSKSVFLQFVYDDHASHAF